MHGAFWRAGQILHLYDWRLHGHVAYVKPNGICAEYVHFGYVIPQKTVKKKKRKKRMLTRIIAMHGEREISS